LIKARVAEEITWQTQCCSDKEEVKQQCMRGLPAIDSWLCGRIHHT
jgi:hypothetical protein